KESTNTKASLINKMRYFEQDTDLELTLENFLNHYHLSVYDFYGKSANRSFQRMKVAAGVAADFECDMEKEITNRLTKLFHLNYEKLLAFLMRYVEARGTLIPENDEERLMMNMFYYSFFQKEPAKEGFASIQDGLVAVLVNDQMRTEIYDVLEFNYKSIQTLEISHDFDFTTPLTVHSTYSTDQIMAALGYYNEDKAPAFREGVMHFKEEEIDVFFTTLNKSEKDFSPSTLYEDYAINETLFHWQSQSRTSVQDSTGQRYINHRKRGSQIELFVREYKKEHGYTIPFPCLVTCDYVSHEGEKSISFVCKLGEEMPPGLVARANKNVV